MKKVDIIGVPEHFNLPWHLAIEDGAFETRGINLEWTDIPEGTGRMSKMLADGETDLAIILTEGLIKSISEGNPTKIAQEYIASPLLWGIHVAQDSSYKNITELKATTAAISRYGSGSHLMAFVNAQNQGWETNDLKFEVINDLEGAIEGLTSGHADYFMWERFTTKPLVDNKTFRRLGDCPTPWPCFVIAVTDCFVQENKSMLRHILEVINMYTAEFKMIPSIDRTIANRYGQQLEDVKVWLSKTTWGQKQISKDDLINVQMRLISLGLLTDIKENEVFLLD
ncbi:substrate-binding domain-containing protein [Croceitalea rosinachiae]|uniref:Substrate-binding domain-containing protein n=1 Tax=Croceitalea rosinachiae TaxID=3075596 RepID=A0ABU3ABT7_9FLAO|nr:substrate-binding domain-containing protein [Croceitalea sp. F388]MDT0607644.1 substrate-binding domain-containing protein [Croceitalea sp. F388]